MKPDKVERATEEGVLEVLVGRKYKLQMGYFMVRTPAQEEMNNIAKHHIDEAFVEVSHCLCDHSFPISSHQSVGKED